MIRLRKGDMMLAIGRVRRDFRVTLPREVREFLKFDEGDEPILYTIEDRR